MNHYTDSDGNKISKQQIDANVKAAKKIKLRNQLNDIGYNRCETCRRNDCKPITNAHIISVDRCQKDPKIPLKRHGLWKI